MGTVVMTSTNVTAPKLVTCPVADDADAFLTLELDATQGTSAATFTFTVSADLQEQADLGWTPLELGSKLRLWVDEHDQVVVSGVISDWGDQSPANNDFTQATATARPATGQSINEYAAPDFDGSNDYLGSNALSSFVTASAYHVFVVLRPQTISGQSATSYMNNGVIADTGAGWWGLFLKNNAGTLQALAFHWDTGEKVAVATGVSLNTDTLIETSFDGSTIRCQVGGETTGTVAAGNIGDTTNAVRIGTGVSLFLDGAIASAIVCNVYLSAAERQAVRGYLSSKYGVAG